MDKIFCVHVYQYVNSAICPHCGNDTHEPDKELDRFLFQEYYKNGKHLEFVCPIDGGTIRGWWSI